MPKHIFEIRPIKWLLEKETIVICAGVMLAAVLIFAVGLIDDLRELSAPARVARSAICFSRSARLKTSAFLKTGTIRPLSV